MRVIGNESSSASRHEEEPGALKVAGRVATGRNGVNDRHVDAQAVLQRTQLLKPFALLQQPLGQRDEALQRLAAISVEPDVVIDRALARGHGGAAEIMRPSDAAAGSESD